MVERTNLLIDIWAQRCHFIILIRAAYTGRFLVKLGLFGSLPLLNPLIRDLVKLNLSYNSLYENKNTVSLAQSEGMILYQIHLACRSTKTYLSIYTYAISDWILHGNRISVMEAPDELRPTFLEQELQNPIGIEKVTEVRLILAGLVATSHRIVFIDFTLVGWSVLK